jgi:sulfotransferase family protein
MSVRPAELADPLFILATPHSSSWTLCAMLGQHPQMYAVPELHLFVAQTVAQWFELCAPASFQMNHGLLRAAAQLLFGAQTETTVRQADGWLMRRSHVTTGFLLECLAEMTHPRLLVEGSPSIVHQVDFLQRAYLMFPQAHFLHLVWHPRVFAESVWEGIREFSRSGPLPPSHWLIQLASTAPPVGGQNPSDQLGAVLDPQWAWYCLNQNICAFLNSLPKDQQLRICGESLRTNAEAVLGQVATWLSLRADGEAVESMKHPDRSPYATLGPPNAPFGTDVFLPGTPSFFFKGEAIGGLDEPLPWRQNGGGFSPEVKELARELGYK